MKNLGISDTNRYIKFGRFFVQTAALSIVVVGGNAIIHDFGLPAPLFIAFVALAGMFFCGWACPFGTAQEWLRHVGKNSTGITLRVPRRLDKYLSLTRYLVVILAVFGVAALAMHDPRKAFSWFFSGRPSSTWAYTALGVMLLASFFMDRPFCRYLCLKGGMHGLMSILRVFTIKRDGNICKECKRCDNSCPMGVVVSGCAAVRDPHCINCFSCVISCPVGGALAFGFAIPSAKDAKAILKRRR